MKFKYYYSNNVLNTFSNEKQEKNTFHIEFIEALKTTIISSGNRQFVLNPLDIVISQHFKQVKIKCKQNKAIRWFAINLKYPSPLNQYLAADNPLIHDLMNVKDKEVNYVVFKNLNTGLCHNYLNNLQIISNQKKQDQFFEFQAQRITGLLFTELLHRHREKIAKSISSFPSNQVKYASHDSQSGAIMSYLNINNGNVSLAQMAKHFGYQKNYLSRLCHKLFDLDFIHLRLNIRMNLASEHLRLTTMSISEISNELGYKDASTFVQNFVKAKHMTPASYRKKFRTELTSEKARPENP